MHGIRANMRWWMIPLPFPLSQKVLVSHASPQSVVIHNCLKLYIIIRFRISMNPWLQGAASNQKASKDHCHCHLTYRHQALAVAMQEMQWTGPLLHHLAIENATIFKWLRFWRKNWNTENGNIKTICTKRRNCKYAILQFCNMQKKLPLFQKKNTLWRKTWNSHFRCRICDSSLYESHLPHRK